MTSIKDRLKIFDPNNTRNRGSTVYHPSNLQLNLKIFPGSTILKEKPKMKIYKYPNKTFPQTDSNIAKVLLFLGNAQECFINTLINIYRNIEFKDEFRYKIDLKDINKYCDIRAFDRKKNDNIRIISIPFCKEKNENYIQVLLDIFKMPRSRFNLICYTFDENINDLSSDQLNEIEFYKYLINYLDLRDKLIFLCSSKEELKNEEIQKFINRFNVEENDYLYEEKKPLDESKKITNEIFFINNKNIYENNTDAEKEWILLMEKMQILVKTIKSSKAKSIGKEISDFFCYLLIDKEDEIKKIFRKLKDKDKYYFFHFLEELKFETDRSKIIANLFSILIKDTHKKIDKNDNELVFNND